MSHTNGESAIVRCIKRKSTGFSMAVKNAAPEVVRTGFMGVVCARTKPATRVPSASGKSRQNVSDHAADTVTKQNGGLFARQPENCLKIPGKIFDAVVPVRRPGEAPEARLVPDDEAKAVG